ncbi:MAG: ribosome biosynthesis protein rrb1 [Watsoniomyces obsoletus]|nr:MAG: ribosome biosynthesis protein rrb1 [Watsoniomyces obsoletus]
MVSTPRSRPPTPGRSPPSVRSPSQQAEDASPSALPAQEGASSSTRPPPPPTPTRRRSSFSFLRRSKSGETMSRRTPSGTRISKKQQRQPSSQETMQELEEQERLKQQQEASRIPPALPALESVPPIHTFGGEDSNEIVSPGTGQTRPKDRHMMSSNQSVPIPPIPEISSRFTHGEDGRANSITHRGRYSYASSMVSTVNSPRRMRRRKDPTPFNVLVVGAKNSGKTSFLNFLRTSLALKPKKRKGQGPLSPTDELEHPDNIPGTRNLHPNFVSQYLETEIDGERVGLTLWDSEGLDKSIVDLQLREMNAFLESKFEETFTEEMKVVRAPGVQDTHIHCVFLVLDPVRLDSTIKEVMKSQIGDMDDISKRNGIPLSSKEVIGGLEEELDVQVLRALQGKTTVVPVISKADTVTTSHMAYLKRAVWGSLKKARLDLLEALGGDEDDEEEEEEDQEANVTNVATNGAEGEENNGNNDSPTGSEIITRPAQIESSNNNILPPLPLSILSPDDPSMEHDSSNGLAHTSGHDNYNNEDTTGGMGVASQKVGRKFPWGFADPYNPDHCDFQKLKEAVFVDWRRDLRVASREMWYERWRTERLRGVSGSYGKATISRR